MSEKVKCLCWLSKTMQLSVHCCHLHHNHLHHCNFNIIIFHHCIVIFIVVIFIVVIFIIVIFKGVFVIIVIFIVVIFIVVIFIVVINTKRYTPLCGPFFSSCVGLQPRRMLFLLIFLLFQVICLV